MEYKGFNGISSFYEFNNLYNGMIDPSTVHTESSLKLYFMKYLIEKIFSVYEFNIPKEWDKSYFLYTLFCNGFISVINTRDYGVIPQHCTLTGRGVYYQPTRVIVSNPLFDKAYDLRIGEMTEIIKLQPNYSGIIDIVSYYADLLALASETVSSNLVNSKLAYVFMANDKAQAESFKKLYDQISTNNPAVFADKKLFNEDGNPNWLMFNQNVGQNYIASNILVDMNKVMDMFNTDIGIPNANTEKRERLVIDEVNANNIDTTSKASLWLETMQEGIEKVNNMFDLDLSVEFRFKDEAQETGLEVME